MRFSWQVDDVTILALTKQKAKEWQQVLDLLKVRRFGVFEGPAAVPFFFPIVTDSGWFISSDLRETSQLVFSKKASQFYNNLEMVDDHDLFFGWLVDRSSCFQGHKNRILI